MSTRSSLAVSGVAAVVLLLASAGAARAQLTLNPPPVTTFGGPAPLVIQPASNGSTVGTLTASTIRSRLTGDLLASLPSIVGPGTVSGAMSMNSLVPFSVGALPVRLSTASVTANFKLVASGGNAIPDGGDPVISVRHLVRLYQQTGATPSPSTEPWLSAIEFVNTDTQNGNGLQVIDRSYAAQTSNYILTPGNYYLFQQIFVTASYTTNGVIQPVRGFAVEFGGISGYNGFEYTVNWQTVPTPGAASVLGLAGFIATRRRR